MAQGLGETTFSAETPVRQAMSRGVIALPEDSTIGACALAMRERRTHAILIVTSEREPLGWIFHLDILRHIAGDPLTTLARDAVSATAEIIEPEVSVQEAAERMVDGKVTHLLVAKSRQSIPEGVLSTWDLVSFFARAFGHAI